MSINALKYVKVKKCKNLVKLIYYNYSLYIIKLLRVLVKSTYFSSDEILSSMIPITFVNSNNKYGRAFEVNREMLCERYENYKNPTYYKNNASDLVSVDTNAVITFVKPKK